MLEVFSLIVAAVSFTALAYIRYTLALRITVFLLPIYLVRFSLGGIPTNLFELLIGITFLIGLLRADIRSQWKNILGNLPAYVYVLVVLSAIALTISTLVSPHLETSLGILKSWIIFPAILAWQVYVMANVHRKFTQTIINTLIASGTAISLVSLLYLSSQDRLYGFYDVPNSLALLLAPILILATTLWVKTRSKALFVSIVIMGASLLLTQSLGAVIAVIGALIVFVALKYRQAHSVALIGAIIIILGFIFTPKISYLLKPESSAAVRLQLWSISQELIKEHPLVGVGLGTFEPAYQEKLHQRFIQADMHNSPRPIPEFVFRDPHNWIFSFWLNTGLLGLALFITINAVAVWKALSSKKNVKSNILGFALITILLFGLVDTIFWKNDLAALQSILLALIYSSSLKI